MRRILDRYIFREVATSWLGVTAVLLMILLTNQFARVLGDVAKGYLPKDAAFQVIGLTAVQYMTILVPIGLFLAIMLALGRLYRDSELPAMMACRLGPAGIYRPLLWLVIPLTLGVGWLSLEVGPRALLAVERIGAEARREADLGSIEPGRFTIFGPERAVVYGEGVSEGGVIENVFLQRQTEDGLIQVVVAESGEQVESEDENTRMFVLRNGRRYEGIPGTTEFRVLEFIEHGIPYQLPTLEDSEPEPRQLPLLTLLRGTDLRSIAEVHWRIGVPLSTLVLALLAVPLSRSRPREGRYGRIAVGLLIFIIYLNMLSAAKAWIEQGEMPAALGLWWVHAAMLLFGLGLLAMQGGWHKRLKPGS